MPKIETGNFAPARWALCPPSPIRVVDWNIDRGSRLSGIIDFLADAKADIILLQESDLNARRTHHLNIAREISQKLEINYVFGREFQELTEDSRTSPAYHGQATLSRWPLSNARIIRFRKQSNFWRPHWFLPEIEAFQERLGGRIALVSDANVAGKSVTTYNVHLESKGDDGLRCSQLAEALEDSRRYDSNASIVARRRLQSRCLRRGCRERTESRAISRRLPESARPNNAKLILRTRPRYRLDLYTRLFPLDPAPSPSVHLCFRPLSSLREVEFHLELDWFHLLDECPRRAHPFLALSQTLGALHLGNALSITQGHCRAHAALIQDLSQT